MFRRTLMSAAGATALLAATLAPAQAATYAVTASAPTKADSGALFTITGKVTGSGAGRKTLKIQRKIGTAPWKTYTTVTTTKAGTYTRSVRMTSIGVKKFRVVAPAQGAVKQGISSTRTVTGFAWIRLVEQPHNSTGDKNWDTTAHVAGAAYRRSVQYTGEGVGRDYFKVHEVCDRVRFGLGIDDNNTNDTPQHVDVSGFGNAAQVFASTDATDTIATYDESIHTGITYLYFGVSNSAGSTVAVTTPQVHCSVARLGSLPTIVD